jgi:hypothetical protein
MATLPELIPDPDLVLQMDASDIAPIVLRLARERIQNGMFNRDSLTATSPAPGTPQYPHGKSQRVEIRVAEGFEWLRQALLIVPASGMNGNNGWFVLTERAETLKSDQDFAGLKVAMAFPKSLPLTKALSAFANASRAPSRATRNSASENPGRWTYMLAVALLMFVSMDSFSSPRILLISWDATFRWSDHLRSFWSHTSFARFIRKRGLASI